MEKEWLRENIPVKALNNLGSESDQKVSAIISQYGFSNELLQFLTSKIRAGDEVWTFSSSSEFWEADMGRAGICILRDGEIVDSIVTIMS